MIQVTRAIRNMGILLTDEDDEFLSAMLAHLKSDGFQKLHAARTAAEATAIVTTCRHSDDEIAFLLIDYRLPDNSSPVLIKTLKEYNDMVVIATTSQPSEIDRIQCMAFGALRYLTKPCDPMMTLLKIEQSLTRFYLNRQLKKSTSDSEKVFLELLAIMVRIIEAKDLVVRDHSENVARLAMSIAAQIGFNDREMRRIGIAGLLHDMGKMAIREDILHKPGKLDLEEWRQMKKHPLVAATVLEPLAELEGVIPSIRYHHERYDGSGYPDGLIGNAIPLGARIIHLAEAFDMMTTDTSYQRAKTPRQALREIQMLTGVQFDPDVTNAFQRSIQKAEIFDPVNLIHLLVQEVD